MTSKDEILAKIDEIAGELAHARESLLKGELVPIENINARIDDQCAAILEIDPDDAITIKPALDELLLNLKTFSEEIDYVQNKVKEILAEQDKQRKDSGTPESE
tara:strand:+ start:262 stop:573 length:312 start_codon:yes stop_codon:yes gene_type:complete